MTPAPVAVILLSLLSSATTVLGVVLALALQESTRALAAGLGFSTGIMVFIALEALLPESIAVLGLASGLASAGLGATLIWAAQLAVRRLQHVPGAGDGAEATRARSAGLVVSGLILHDVPEGFAMANAYIASPDLGVLIALASALHKLPEKFALAVPAVTLRSRRFLYAVGVLSGLAEPLGAVIGLAATGMAPALNAWFLGLAAGAMLFVCGHELIPMSRRYRHTAFFLTGAGLAALVHGFLAHAILGRAGP